MSYLTNCQEHVRELIKLYDDYVKIAENSNVEWEHRFSLVMSDSCYGRIKELFKLLGIDFYTQHDNIPRILGYETCVNLTESEIRWRLESLKGLLPAE